MKKSPQSGFLLSGCLVTLWNDSSSQILKTQKVGMSPVVKQYTVSALLCNAKMCLYGSTTS